MACKPDSEGACLRPLEGLLLHHLKLAVWLEGGNDVRQWRWGRMHHFSIPKWAQCHRNSAALLRGHHRPGGKMMDELPSSLSCLTTVYTHTHTPSHINSNMHSKSGKCTDSILTRRQCVPCKMFTKRLLQIYTVSCTPAQVQYTYTHTNMLTPGHLEIHTLTHTYRHTHTSTHSEWFICVHMTNN